MNDLDSTLRTIDNCIKHFDTLNNLRRKIFKLYKHGKKIDYFVSLVKISEYLGASANEVRRLEAGEPVTLAMQGWSIKALEPKKLYSQYDKEPRNRELIQYMNGKEVDRHKSIKEAAKKVRASHNTIRVHVSSGRVKRVQGYTFKWDTDVEEYNRGFYE